MEVLSATYRIRCIGKEIEERTLRSGSGFVGALWHQRLFGAGVFFARLKPAIMISQSRDGDLIANAVALMGYRPIRGSSTRGGKAALETIRELPPGGVIGHIVDGPRGPAEVVKSGLIRIAHKSGSPIIPLIVSPEKKWIFKSWDKFMIPKPFSRIIIRMGTPMGVDPDIDHAGFEEKRLCVESDMKKLHQELDSLWAQPEEINRLFSKK